MYGITRVGKYLLPSTQWFQKMSSIRIATDEFAHCCHFCKQYLRLSIDSIITNKHIAIVNVTLGSQYKGIYFHHLRQSFEVNPVPARSFHNCTEYRSRRISSSTVTDTTAAEDVTITGSEMSHFVVGHDQDKKYFYIKLQEPSSNQEESLAKLEYEWIRPSLVDMYHTEVPPQFQGKGIAKVLATAAFEAFCEQGVEMRPTCTYLQKYLRENQIPRYLDHIEKGFVL